MARSQLPPPAAACTRIGKLTSRYKDNVLEILVKTSTPLTMLTMTANQHSIGLGIVLHGLAQPVSQFTFSGCVLNDGNHAVAVEPMALNALRHGKEEHPSAGMHPLVSGWSAGWQERFLGSYASRLQPKANSLLIWHDWLLQSDSSIARHYAVPRVLFSFEPIP